MVLGSLQSCSLHILVSHLGLAVASPTVHRQIAPLCFRLEFPALGGFFKSRSNPPACGGWWIILQSTQHSYPTIDAVLDSSTSLRWPVSTRGWMPQVEKSPLLRGLTYVTTEWALHELRHLHAIVADADL
jgi:hypothetical protein